MKLALVSNLLRAFSIPTWIKSSYFLPISLAVLLILKALLIFGVIFYAGIELGPDEAQYWTWSQALDWGYYSKPPGIAWQIWLGTKLFGQTEWGVRSFSLLIATCQSLAVYFLALRAGLFQRTAFWCSLMMAFSPIGILGSFLAITDVGFLFCWTGACLAVVAALHQNKAPNPIEIGGWVLAGALFKWPIYLFWIFYLCSHFWYFPQQKKKSLIGGVLFSLLGLLPSLLWNVSHDWATFRHVFATFQGGSGSHKAAGNIGEFLGSQAFLLSPLLFLLLIGGCWQWVRKRNTLSPSLFFCGFVTLGSLGAMSLAACFQKIQGNWISFAYPTAIIILGWDCFQQHPVRAWWAKIGLLLSILLTVLIFILPSFYTSPMLSSYTPSYRINPFKHNLGWTVFHQVLEKHGYDSAEHFLVADKYQTTSVLSFYGEGKKRAYFLNLNGARKNQFSYWPSLQNEQQGKAGFFVWIENMPHLKRNWEDKLDFYQNELQEYFKEVEFLELAPLVYEGSSIAKGALIYRCRDCKNLAPIDPQIY